MKDKEYFSIRPSQVARTFGPGSIYDNQKDSMIIMGLDYWQPEKFNSIRDEILLQEIKKNGFDGVTQLISVSSFKESENHGVIPVKSFPTWGFCPRCHKLVSNRNKKIERGITCDSVDCREKEKSGIAEIPRTYPVRFVAACENGHLDDFPWYRWVHRTKDERNACSHEDAKLYFDDDSGSISLTSLKVKCKGKKCVAKPQSMSTALSKNGLKQIIFGCTRRRPWLNVNSQECEAQIRGIFKGATNIYFPIVRSAVTIPPFSDELSKEIMDNYKDILKFRNAWETPNFKSYLTTKFHLKPEHSDGKWTVEDCLEKISAFENFNERDKHKDVYRLEFDALNSKEDYNDAEFVTEILEDVPVKFRNYIDHVVLVKKIRVISALIGFTRVDPLNSNENTQISRLSKESLSWLPVIENRGEGIFFCINNEDLKKWLVGHEIRERFENIMTVQGKMIADSENYKNYPRYVFLHTLSHVMMRGLSIFAGYSTASFTERIYSGEDMAGILIYTSSPSSDGALGGLVDLGRKNKNKIWDILENAIQQSTQCSCDPFCSMQEVEKMSQLHGASCHACTILPETCCENMNSLLDRELVSSTLKSDIGFVKM